MPIHACMYNNLSMCMLRHSLTTRFLTSCISSHLFAGNQTLYDLHLAFAQDARQAFFEGVEAALINLASSYPVVLLLVLQPMDSKQNPSSKVAGGLRLHLVCIAGKGDWKYLRQACLGYQCRECCALVGTSYDRIPTSPAEIGFNSL